MNLLESSLLYHVATSLYLIPHYSTMILLLSTWLNNTLLPHSTWLYIYPLWFYFTLPDSTLLYYLIPHDSTLIHCGSTSPFLTLHHSSIPLLYSAWFYITYHHSPSLPLTLPYSTIALFHCTRVYITLSWLYFTLLDSTLLCKALLHSTWLYTILYHRTLSLYLSLCYCTMALHHSTWPYATLPWPYLIPQSTRLYINVQWFYFNLPNSILLYHRSTSLYLVLLYSIMALLYSTWLYVTLPWPYVHNSTRLYINLPWFYFNLPDSTLLYHGSTSLDSPAPGICLTFGFVPERSLSCSRQSVLLGWLIAVSGFIRQCLVASQWRW